jgi:hypothetical protein
MTAATPTRTSWRFSSGMDSCGTLCFSPNCADDTAPKTTRGLQFVMKTIIPSSDLSSHSHSSKDEALTDDATFSSKHDKRQS